MASHRIEDLFVYSRTGYTDKGWYEYGGHIYRLAAHLWPPGVLGIWGEWLFIFTKLGSHGNCFRGAREQAHNFGDIGSLSKKQKKIRKSLHFV